MRKIIFFFMFYPILALLILNFSNFAVAEPVVQISFQDQIGKLEWTSPAKEIFGFAGQPKTPRQKADQKKALKTIETDIQSLFEFEPSLNCQFEKDDIEVTKGNPPKLQAVFDMTCTKSPKGTALNVLFRNNSRVSNRLRS